MTAAPALRLLGLGRVVSHDLRCTRPVSERAPLLRVGIFYQAIYLPPFMIVWQMFRNREAFGVHKQQTMAVFVDLHLITGTDPAAQLGFCSLVRIKIARTERLTYFFDVSR